MSKISRIQEELRHNWDKWLELVDDDNEICGLVVAIMNDAEDDKEGRINELIDYYTERAAKYAIDSGVWCGDWGDLKRAAGLVEPCWASFEPTPFNTKSKMSKDARDMMESGHSAKDFG